MREARGTLGAAFLGDNSRWENGLTKGRHCEAWWLPESSPRPLPPPKGASPVFTSYKCQVLFEMGRLIHVPWRLSAAKKQYGKGQGTEQPGAESRVGCEAVL